MDVESTLGSRKVFLLPTCRVYACYLVVNNTEHDKFVKPPKIISNTAYAYQKAIHTRIHNLTSYLWYFTFVLGTFSLCVYA